MFIRFILFVGALASLLLIGRWEHSVVVAVAGTVYALLLSTLLEWAVHKYIYHGTSLFLSSLRRAHLFHHHAFVGGDYIVPPYEPAYRRHRGPRLNLDSAIVRVGQVLVHWFVIALILTLPSWVLTRSLVFTCTVTITGGIFSTMNFYLHETMHRRTDRWIAKTPLFQWLDTHHRGHHHNPRMNLNLIFPLVDYLFGTVAQKQQTS